MGTVYPGQFSAGEFPLSGKIRVFGGQKSALFLQNPYLEPFSRHQTSLRSKFEQGHNGELLLDDTVPSAAVRNSTIMNCRAFASSIELLLIARTNTAFFAEFTVPDPSRSLTANSPPTGPRSERV